MSMALMATSTFAGNGNTKTNSDATNSYTVNTEKSNIFWTGEKVTGEHTGTLDIQEGTITVENGVPARALMRLDMASITVTDIEDPETNGKLVGHLKSADFFNTSEFKSGSFEATSFTPIKGAKDREPNYNVKGKLTIKGITQDIEFPVFFMEKNGKVVASGTATFDRTKYDIKYGSGTFFDDIGDKAIYDEVKLNFVLSAAI